MKLTTLLRQNTYLKKSLSKQCTCPLCGQDYWHGVDGVDNALCPSCRAHIASIASHEEASEEKRLASRRRDKVPALGYWKRGDNHLEHRVVMEEYLGRPLRDDEIVHHKDGNKMNNNIENLEIMSRSEHTTMHMTEYWKEKKENINEEKAR